MKDDIIGMVRTAMLSGTFNRPAFEDALKNLEIVAAANERDALRAVNAQLLEALEILLERANRNSIDPFDIQRAERAIRKAKGEA